MLITLRRIRPQIWALALIGALMSGVWISDGWGGPGCENSPTPSIVAPAAP